MLPCKDPLTPHKQTSVLLPCTGAMGQERHSRTRTIRRNVLSVHTELIVVDSKTTAVHQEWGDSGVWRPLSALLRWSALDRQNLSSDSKSATVSTQPAS